jgi:hypothetical protein
MLLVDVGSIIKTIVMMAGFITVGAIGLLVAIFGFLRPILQSREPANNTGKIIAGIIIAVFSLGSIVAGLAIFING